MIILGADNSVKNAAITHYVRREKIKKIVMLAPRKFFLACEFENCEQIEWAEVIQYKFFYRLLQEIDDKTLIIVNECLRVQNRYDLTYNCIRHFLNKTNHQIIFQHLPVINDLQDFMILFDFDTQSRWKREKFNAELLKETVITMNKINFDFNEIPVECDAKLHVEYQHEKQKLVANIGLKDPDTIPRNLYLMSGKAKFCYLSQRATLFDVNKSQRSARYIGRNNRFKAENFQTYKDDLYDYCNYTIFEFPHNFIEFSTFAALAGQSKFDVFVSDLKVDNWYLQRFREWTQRINDAYASL